jgi:hypothetical protein
MVPVMILAFYEKIKSKNGKYAKNTSSRGALASVMVTWYKTFLIESRKIINEFPDFVGKDV